MLSASHHSTFSASKQNWGDKNWLKNNLLDKRQGSFLKYWVDWMIRKNNAHGFVNRINEELKIVSKFYCHSTPFSTWKFPQKTPNEGFILSVRCFLTKYRNIGIQVYVSNCSMIIRREDCHSKYIGLFVLNWGRRLES